MNFKNLLIILALLSGTVIAFLWGGYHTLTPVLFILGFIAVTAICAWAAIRMETRDFVVVTVVSLATAVVDEYAHTSAGAFTCFDGVTPSPLTVFGWGLFIMGNLTISQFLHEKIPLETLDSGALRVAPALISMALLIACAWIQGYFPVFTVLLVLVYIVHGVASLYYSYLHPLGWNVWVMAVSLVVGALMEFLGAMEGLWVYRFGEPLPLFMAFTWTLRTWTILAVSSLFDVDFLSRYRPVRLISVTQDGA